MTVTTSITSAVMTRVSFVRSRSCMASLGFGALAVVLLELIVQCFQADPQQFRSARLIISCRSQGLQNQFAFHGVHRGADGKLDRGKVAGGLGRGPAKFVGQ